MPRQQTLEASVDWSYALLTEPERAVFRRASVFAGSFDLEAAERVCSDGDVAPHQVLDLLSLLVDKSLILAEDGPGASRFRLLETIRHYALAHLSSCAELDQTRDRHLDVYTELAERAEPNLETRDLIGWLDRLDAEHDNLRAALDRAVQSGAAESGLRLVGASSVYWTTSGRYHETIDVISRLLDQAEEVDAHVRAKAWWAAARCHYALGDASDEARTAGEALRLAGETGDRRLEGRALMQSVWHQVWWSDVDAAKEAMRQAVRISEQVGDWTNVASSLTTLAARELVDGADTALATFSEAEAATRRADNPIDDAALDYWLAWLRIDQGRLEDAARLCDEGLALTRALRSRFDELGFLTTAAAVASYRGETAAARSLVEEGWRLGRSVAIPITFWWLGLADFQAGWAAGDLDFVPRLRDEVLPVVSKLETSGIRAYVLGMLSRAALAQGDLGEGRRLAEAAAAAHPPRGFTERPDLPLARVLRAEGDHHGAEDLYHEAVAHAHKRHARPDAVGLLEELAGAIASQESYAEAARLFGAAQAARDEMGYVRFVTDRPRCEADLQLAREALGDDAFDAAFAEGMTMSLDEAVAYAQRGRGERKRPSSGWASLTPTELEVVKLVRQGKSNPQIADRLHISARTVQTHLTHIFAKLGPSNRTELATEAMRRGI
jgi:DNA-binding CsgD family transcriptional regulator